MARTLLAAALCVVLVCAEVWLHGQMVPSSAPKRGAPYGWGDQGSTSAMAKLAANLSVPLPRSPGSGMLFTRDLVSAESTHMPDPISLLVASLPRASGAHEEAHGGRRHRRRRRPSGDGAGGSDARSDETLRFAIHAPLTEDEMLLLLLHEAEAKEASEALPDEDVLLATHHRTCAVIGETSSLLDGTERGKEIDRHDAVFRFNDRKVDDLNRGVKRSYLFVNERNAATFVPGGDDNKPTIRPKSRAVIVVSSARARTRTRARAPYVIVLSLTPFRTPLAIVRTRTQHGDVSLQMYLDILDRHEGRGAVRTVAYLSPTMQLRVHRFYWSLVDRLTFLGEDVGDASWRRRVPHALVPLFAAMRMCEATYVYGFTSPRVPKPNDAHNVAMQYILRMLSLEGYLEFIN